jgi:hypothetical protein
MKEGRKDKRDNYMKGGLYEGERGARKKKR